MLRPSACRACTTEAHCHAGTRGAAWRQGNHCQRCVQLWHGALRSVQPQRALPQCIRPDMCLPGRLCTSPASIPPLQVLYELLTWRLPWTMAEMSPFKVRLHMGHCPTLPGGAQRSSCSRSACRAGHGLHPQHLSSAASSRSATCMASKPWVPHCVFVLHRSLPSSGGAGGQRCRRARHCPALTPPDGMAWTTMCN